MLVPCPYTRTVRDHAYRAIAGAAGQGQTPTPRTPRGNESRDTRVPARAKRVGPALKPAAFGPDAGNETAEF